MSVNDTIEVETPQERSRKKMCVQFRCVTFLQETFVGERVPGSGYHGNTGFDRRWGVREEREESEEVCMCLFVLGLIASLS